MAAADLHLFLVQEVPQHPAACERKLEAQLVHSAHHGEGGRRHRSGPVVDAAPAHPERLRLLGDRQIMVAVHHRFALSRPALLSAPDKESSVSVSSPILASSVFTSTGGDAALGFRTEHPGGSVQELSLPGRDLVRVHVELLRQLGQRLLALHRSQRHLRLEGRRVVPARSSRHRLSLPAAILAAVTQKLHSSPLSRFPAPALPPPSPVWRALLGALQELFAPPVWHVVIDDTVVERISTGAPGSLIHHNHSAKPNRPRFLRGQGWLCLAAVVEQGWRVGAVPLMLRLVRRGTQRGKLVSARFLLRLLGGRLGRVRLLLDAWFMRARLIEAALADGHTVIGRARRDLALYEVPRPPRRRRRGRPRKYGGRLTRAEVEALPVHRSARILYGKLEVVRYRTRRVAARFLKGRVVRAVWVELERPDRRDRPARGAAAGLHRPRPARDRGRHELRETVGGGTVVRRHEARLGAQGRLAALAPGADALGDDPGRRLRAQPDAGLHRSGAHPGPGRSRPLAPARHPHRRPDPGGHRAYFARGRPTSPRRGDPAGIPSRQQPPHRPATAGHRQSRVARPIRPFHIARIAPLRHQGR